MFHSSMHLNTKSQKTPQYENKNIKTQIYPSDKLTTACFKKTCSFRVISRSLLGMQVICRRIEVISSQQLPGSLLGRQPARCLG